jgi:glycosyltransferase involved in cell wall biosynthesis
MTPISVLVTIPWGARLGGAEEMIWTWLAHVDRCRAEPRAVFFEDGPFPREVAALGVETAVIPTGRLRQPASAARAVRELSRRMKQNRPDVVVNWVAKAQIYGGLAAARAGLSDRTIWWQHGVSKGHWMDRLATAVPARAVGCSSAASAGRQEQLRPRRATFVVHPGVDVAALARDERAALPERASGAVILGMVARLQPWKGQHRFLRALARLRADGHDVQGLIVGGEAHGFSAGYGAELERLCDDLGLTEHVTMTGHVDDAGPYMDVMDVLVSASDNEPFGIVLLEGMAKGLPVVAVSDAGPREIVAPEDTGLLVPRPDADLLAAALERLVADRGLRERMGAAGRERVTERFSAQRMAEGLTAQLERFAGRSRAEVAADSPGAPQAAAGAVRSS